MKQIKDLFYRQIDRTIEEDIKIDQTNEQSVVGEIEEYVFTDSLQQHFATLLDELLRSKSKPREGIGVWVSGFFGSGKSLFAKMLAYVIENRTLLGYPASSRFIEQTEAQLSDTKIKELLTVINRDLPFKAIIFDVSMDRGTRSGNERITEILYRRLLHEFGYPTDFDLAALEIKKEKQEKLESFKVKFRELGFGNWDDEKKLDPLNEASATLHALEPTTYPNIDSWSNTVGKTGREDITPNLLAERAFELAKRRFPGKALIFIVDEVGQYVARSEDKMLDLQAVVQALGREGKNRTESQEIVSPAWLIVTAQEKLNEVVSALDSKRSDLGKLQERFRLQLDINQADISEVTGKRVLVKSDAGKECLQTLYHQNEARLVETTSLERSARKQDLHADRFTELYPYLPYQIDLCIDIVAGFRLRRGAHRHIGGSNRTIIKQAQEMMINPATNLANESIGALVTLDRVYELMRLGNLLPSEVTREIENISKQIDHPFAERVAQVIALLEPVNDLPRTAKNLAVLLHPSVDAPSCISEVQEALDALQTAQFVRDTDEGFKLLTAQEKSWDTTRNGHDPKRPERNKIQKGILNDLFRDPKVQDYFYKNLRRFKPDLSVSGEPLEGNGEFKLNLLLAEDEGDFKEQLASARGRSINEPEQLFWAFKLTDEVYGLTTELCRSTAMVSQHDWLSAQGKLTSEEISCLNDEKRRRDRLERELTVKFRTSLLSGSGFFQGVQKDASALGNTITEVFHNFFDLSIPFLYPKLEVGVLDVSDKDADTFLTSANLQGLPQVFYNSDSNKSLVVKEGAKMVPNLNAELCREIFEFLRREHSYGNKVTGKSLAHYFSGQGYGWHRETIRLALAVLLRGGSIELTHQGRKYWNYNEPACRVPFTNNNAFNAASFAPREALDLKILAAAANAFEDITGSEVDIEEGAISQAFRQLAAQDRESLLPLVAKLSAERLPEAEIAQNHLSTLEGVAEMPSDDVVKTLSGEGKSFHEARREMKKIDQLATDANIAQLRLSKSIMSEQWPLLQNEVLEETLEASARTAEEIINSGECLSNLEKLKKATQAVHHAYRNLYSVAFEERRQAYQDAIGRIKGLKEWAELDKNPDVSDEQLRVLLQPLTEKVESELELAEGATIDSHSRATLPQLRSEIAAANSVAATLIEDIERLVAPEEKVERISVSNLSSRRIHTEAELDLALSEIRAHAVKLLKQNINVILE